MQPDPSTSATASDSGAGERASEPEKQLAFETTLAGSYCPHCGTVVPFSEYLCPVCHHSVEHHPSQVQRNGLLAGLGFIVLAGILIFLQPNPLGVIPSRWLQDVMEGGIITCVAGAGISFFAAVLDMVRRGGE